MYAPEGSRLVVIRGPGLVGQRIAVLIDGLCYVWRCASGRGGSPAFNHRPRKEFTIVRDATPREAQIGMVT